MIGYAVRPTNSWQTAGLCPYGDRSAMGRPGVRGAGSFANRQRRRRFDFRKGDHRAYLLDAGHTAQFAQKERFIRFNICCNDAQQKIGRAHHYIAFENLWKFADSVRELFDIFPPLRGEPNLRKNLRVETHFLAVEKGYLPGDHAKIAHALDATPAWSRGQPCLARHLCQRQTRIALQDTQDASLGVVETGGRNFLIST